MSYSLAEPSIIDKVMKGEIKLNYKNVKIKEEESWMLAGEIVKALEKYGVEVIDGDYPIIIVYLNKFLIIIVPLGKKLSVTGELSLEIFEKISNIIENLKDNNNKKIVIIYFSPGGKLLLSAYLFLGYLIEKHDVGILFVNGGVDEVLEVIEKLGIKGSFAPEEEDYVDLKAIS